VRQDADRDRRFRGPARCPGDHRSSAGLRFEQHDPESLDVPIHLPVGEGEEIALLVSDVVMPLMDGPTMVREARKTRPDLPILFMSGYAEEQLRKSIDIANVAFLPKPFSVQDLAEAVRNALAVK